MGQASNAFNAGYMTKQLNNVYDGEFYNDTGVPIYNGTIVSLSDNLDSLEPASTGALQVLCKELTTIYGDIPAARFTILNTPDFPFYLVDNQADVNVSGEYDATNYSTPDGELLRAHPLQVGEEFIATTPNSVSVGSTYGVANGRVGSYSDPT